MVKKAVVIGINYNECSKYRLKGSVNDAYVLASTLIKTCDFDQSNIVLLIDENPDYCQKKAFFSAEGREPTKKNIINSILWLVNSNPDEIDTVLFYFSGLSTCVVDESNEHAVEYYDALMPCDYLSRVGKVAILLLEDIKNLLQLVPIGIQVICIVDSCIGSVHSESYTPICNPKIRLPNLFKLIASHFSNSNYLPALHSSKYDKNAWQCSSIKRFRACPKFIPDIKLKNLQEQRTVSLFQILQNHKKKDNIIFLILSSSFPHVSLERQCYALTNFDHLSDPYFYFEFKCNDLKNLLGFYKSVRTIHGVMTFSLVIALVNLHAAGESYTFKELVDKINIITETFSKADQIRSIDQTCHLDVPNAVFLDEQCNLFLEHPIDIASALNIVKHRNKNNEVDSFSQILNSNTEFSKFTCSDIEQP